jgi:GNAT superfamily N-acetyltransferase
MEEPRIRAATADDVSAIVQIVDQAYRHYIARIGKPPGPMLDDYAAHVLEGAVWVLEEGAAIAGIIVLLPRTGYLLLDNVAVSPARQGLGLGRQLLAFAEAEALRRGCSEIRLYTHQTMVEKSAALRFNRLRRDGSRHRGRLTPRLHAQAASRITGP